MNVEDDDEEDGDDASKTRRKQWTQPASAVHSSRHWWIDLEREVTKKSLITLR